MPKSEHYSKAFELIELFKAWGIGPGDAIAIAREMSVIATTATSWDDPLEGTPYKAEAWNL